MPETEYTLRNGRICVFGNIGLEQKLFVSSLPSNDSEALVYRSYESPGGSALFCSAALSILGCENYLVSQLGGDSEGRRVKSLLDEAHVDTTHLYFSGSTTIRFITIYDRNYDRTVLLKQIRWNKPAALQRLTKALDNSDVLVLCPASPSLSMEVAELGKKRNKLLVVSPLGAFSRRSTGWINRFFGLADFLFMNEDELCLYARSDNLDQALKRLRFRNSQTLVVTRGEEGSVVITNTERIYQSASASIKVKDPTGAGDAFLAGFLWSLKRGYNIRRATFYASEAGQAFVKGMTLQEKMDSLKNVFHDISNEEEGPIET